MKGKPEAQEDRNRDSQRGKRTRRTLDVKVSAQGHGRTEAGTRGRRPGRESPEELQMGLGARNGGAPGSGRGKALEAQTRWGGHSLSPLVPERRVFRRHQVCCPGGMRRRQVPHWSHPRATVRPAASGRQPQLLRVKLPLRGDRGHPSQGHILKT